MSRKKNWLEAAALIAAWALLIFLQRGIWISGSLTVTHDTLRHYPLFAFFADSLQAGHLPLWEPYLEGGQPFWIISSGMAHLWQPWTLALIGAGKIARVGLLNLYQLNLLAGFFIFTAGVYFLFKHLTGSRLAAFAGFCSLVFSSFSVNTLVQIGFLLDAALWPWMALCVFKCLEGGASRWLPVLAALLALAAQSYHILYAVTALSILTAFAPVSWKKCRPSLPAGFLSAVFLALLGAKILPEIARWDQIVPVLRSEVTGGAQAIWGDLLFLILPSPPFVEDVFVNSEAAIYLGIVPLGLALYGLIRARHPFKKAFAALALVSLALALSGLPLFRIIRNTHNFLTYSALSIAFFCALGVKALEENWADSVPKKTRAIEIILGTALITGCVTIFLLYSALMASWLILGYFLLWHGIRRGNRAALAVILILSALADASVYIPWASASRLGSREKLIEFARERGYEIPLDSLPPHAYSNRRETSVNGEYFFHLPAILRRATAQHQAYPTGSHFYELKSYNASALTGDRLWAEGGSVKLISFEPNRTELRVNCDKPCVLHRSENDDPDWRVNKPLSLPAGEHTVVFEYFPKLFLAALALYFLGLAAFGLYIAFNFSPKS